MPQEGFRHGSVRGRSRILRLAIAMGTGAAALTAALVVFAGGATALRDHVGMLGAKRARLVTDWTVTPAGAATTVGPSPMRAVWAPDGEHLLVGSSGYAMSALQVVEAATGRVSQTVKLPPSQGLFLGLAYSADGRHAYAAGGGDDLLHTYTVAADGTLKSDGDISVASAGPRDAAGVSLFGDVAAFPAGIAVSSDGRSLYVALNEMHALGVVDLTARKLVRTAPVGGFPYDVAVSHGRIIVTNWADASATVLDEKTLDRVGQAVTGRHPTGIAVDGRRVAIANANDDTVSLFMVDDPRHVTTIPVGHGELESSSPQDLAFSADGKRLYVALAGDNAIGVVDLAGPKGKLIGRIPTGWYPTGVRFDAKRNAILAISGKGYGSGPNATGVYPDPSRRSGPFQDGYQNADPELSVTNMMKGLVTRIPAPSAEELARATEEVRRDDRPASPGVKLPAEAAKIDHVIYIIRENRTYDQVFGDEAFADGDPEVTLFGREVTPNAHALVERFGLWDNFYVDADGSADGHNWSLAADASDYTERTMLQPGRTYDYEGASEIAKTPGKYLWDVAAEAGVSYRDYGEWYSLDRELAGNYGRAIAAGTECEGPVSTNYLGTAKTWHMLPGPAVGPGQVVCLPKQRLDDEKIQPRLAGHFDPKFRSWDLQYSDVDREAEWKREFDHFVAEGNLPRLEILRLGNNHTMGGALGGYTPQAMVADNDLALGRLVEAVSHSKYWESTAIFVVEDDASNGADHVDAHRSPMLVISAYGSHRAPMADHSFADTAGLLKTIEALLGLKPMSHFDAVANPMSTAFAGPFDPRPFDALPARISTTAKNTVNDAAARAARRMDFIHPDAVEPEDLNGNIAVAAKNATCGGVEAPCAAKGLWGTSAGR